MIRRTLCWIFYKSPRMIGAVLGLYAIWYTHIALAPITHECRVRQIDDAFMLALLETESG